MVLNAYCPENMYILLLSVYTFTKSSCREGWKRKTIKKKNNNNKAIWTMASLFPVENLRFILSTETFSGFKFLLLSLLTKKNPRRSLHDRVASS